MYVYFGSFGLLAYDLDGKELWRRPLPIPDKQHGSGASPILVDSMAIINCDQKQDSYLLAVDQSSGEQVWKTERPSASRIFSWSTPILWKHDNEQELVVLGSRQLTGYDLSNGQETWGIKDLPIQTH